MYELIIRVIDIHKIDVHDVTKYDIYIYTQIVYGIYAYIGRRSTTPMYARISSPTECVGIYNYKCTYRILQTTIIIYDLILEP